jgi:single-strand DNA-binding protein
VNETNVTFIGNVATDIRSAHSRDGVPITSFRLASTTRRFERGMGWSDVDTIFVTVVCWRQLAEHAASSFSKGEPVIVTGRLRMRQWTGQDGRSGTAVELEAVAAGHDLSRGTAAFTRSSPRPVERATLGTAAQLDGAGAAESLAEPAAEPDRQATASPASEPAQAGADPDAVGTAIVVGAAA